MEEQKAVSVGFQSIPRTDSKIAGDKRERDQFEEQQDFSRKTRILDSVLESVCTCHAHDPKNIRNKESGEKLRLQSEEMFLVSKISQTLNTEASETRNNNNKMSDLEAENTCLRELDLNANACCANESESNEVKRQLMMGKQDGNKRLAQKGIGLDLNGDAVSSSVNDDLSFCSSKKHNNDSKSKDAFSVCGSYIGPIEERDSMQLWKAMKQNGFLSGPHGGTSAASSYNVSSSHGGIPAPKKGGRKIKSDWMKKKIDIAKREEIDRFAKIAAPTGLLNQLNPGIIHHVRNKKQVLQMIQNLVRSEKDSGNLHRTQMKDGGALGGSRKSPEDTDKDALLSDCNRTFKHSATMDETFRKSCDGKCGNGNLSIVNSTNDNEDESEKFSGAGVLTLKAATVASKWLELLHQDIKLRLLALRRSKKRVRSAITTELPFLVLKEFSSNQDRDSKTATADMHRSRWTALFNQMDQTLLGEERQLESWLNQVKELRLDCDQGLQQLNRNSDQSLVQLGIPLPDPGMRPGELNSDKELAVRAAAASIYSTCNYLLSKEDLACS